MSVPVPPRTCWFFIDPGSPGNRQEVRVVSHTRIGHADTLWPGTRTSTIDIPSTLYALSESLHGCTVLQEEGKAHPSGEPDEEWPIWHSSLTELLSCPASGWCPVGGSPSGTSLAALSLPSRIEAPTATLISASGPASVVSERPASGTPASLRPLIEVDGRVSGAERFGYVCQNNGCQTRINETSDVVQHSIGTS